MSQEFKLEWHGKAYSDAVMASLYNQIRQEAEVVLQQTDLDVPLRDGDLLASANYDIERTGQKVSASVYYDTPYAVKLHEHPEYDFGNGRKGLYLADVMAILNAEIIRRIQFRITQALRGVFK